ncbi:MAG: RNA polymerase sigma-54 factor, partial [Bilophila sp.]
MVLELRQQLKLTQQLVMTPQLQQAIRLLQLSRLELVETVQHELLENPFLEEVQEEVSTEPAESRAESPQTERYEREAARSEDWEDYLGEFASTPQHMQQRDYELPEEMSSLEARYSSSPTLESHLMWQLRLSSLTDEQKELGEIIIGNLSSSGYLQATAEEMATMANGNAKDIADANADTAMDGDAGEPPVTAEQVESVLKTLQHFDPVGVAARTPQECLLIQIETLGYDRDATLVDLVRNHLEDLE